MRVNARNDELLVFICNLESIGNKLSNIKQIIIHVDFIFCSLFYIRCSLFVILFRSSWRPETSGAKNLHNSPHCHSEYAKNLHHTHRNYLSIVTIDASFVSMTKKGCHFDDRRNLKIYLTISYVFRTYAVPPKRDIFDTNLLMLRINHKLSYLFFA